MKRAGFGRIVTISSGAGLRPSLTGIQAYAAAKHALVGLTKQLSFELGPHGDHRELGRARLRPLEPDDAAAMGELRARRAEDGSSTGSTPSASATPEDIAARRLCSSRASRPAWISGQVLSVDGGRS